MTPYLYGTTLTFPICGWCDKPAIGAIAANSHLVRIAEVRSLPDDWLLAAGVAHVAGHLAVGLLAGIVEVMAFGL